jgi:magnesium chelatase family protein
VRERVVAARGRRPAAARPTAGALHLLMQAAERLALSARAYGRTLRVARTIARLGLADTVGENHVLEALQYRTDNMG